MWFLAPLSCPHRIQRLQGDDTMTTVEKLGGNWVIVRDQDMNAPDEVDGSSAAGETGLSSNREFWTSDGWAAQYGFAKQFATQEEAETYLAERGHEMG
jgi:hypothetical protein